MNAERILKDFSKTNKIFSQKLEKDFDELKSYSIDEKYNKHLNYFIR